jgi:hypothetical protein
MLTIIIIITIDIECHHIIIIIIAQQKLVGVRAATTDDTRQQQHATRDGTATRLACGGWLSDDARYVYYLSIIDVLTQYTFK